MLPISEPPIASARIGLRLLHSDLSRAVLRALGAGPLSIGGLCACLVLESDTALREQLERLRALGAVEMTEGPGSAAAFRLTRAGEGFHAVMARAAVWLTTRPGRALSPESPVAWRAVAALGDGWEFAVIQHLVVRMSTRAELLRTIPALSKAKAKRMLRRLAGAGVLRPLDPADPAPRYAVTAWGRRAIAVLATIAHWERAHLRVAAEPVAAVDGAVALLASLPLVRPRADIAGVCSFTVEADAGVRPRSSAVWARCGDGLVTACRPGISPAAPDAWVHGGVDAWLAAVIHARVAELQIGGDRAFAKCMIRGLHDVLFAEPEASL